MYPCSIPSIHTSCLWVPLSHQYKQPSLITWGRINTWHAPHLHGSVSYRLPIYIISDCRHLVTKAVPGHQQHQCIFLHWNSIVLYSWGSNDDTILANICITRQWRVKSMPFNPWRIKFRKFYQNLFSPTLMILILQVPVLCITLRPRQMDAIVQTTFLSEFCRTKMFEFWQNFHWGLFIRVQLTIFQHRCR